MSTRWYPFYQRGNPQLRVFLPNFWLKLVKPDMNQPKNVVQFHCSMEMTRHDVKNYLEKIYNVPTIKVHTRIALGKTKKNVKDGSIIKEDDIKIAYAILDKNTKFEFPDLFENAKDIEDDMGEIKENLSEFIRSNKTPGSPPWFSS